MNKDDQKAKQTQGRAREQVFYNDYLIKAGYMNRLRLIRCVAILDTLASLRLEKPGIVELGCGTGWLSSILGLVGPTTGVDLSDAAVESAQRAFPHVEFHQADILKWESPRKDYDIAVSHEVIEHVPDQLRYLEVAWGVLRPGGYLILTTPNARTFNAMPEQQRMSWRAQPIENWLYPKELKHLVVARFELLRLTTIVPAHGQKGLYRLFASVRLRRLLARLSLDGQLDHLRLSIGMGLHTLVLARKK